MGETLVERTPEQSQATDGTEAFREAAGLATAAEALPWRCFHCDEVFDSVGGAADHFGSDPTRQPGCLIDRVALEEGGKPERGRGLLMRIRELESSVDEWTSRALRAEMIEEGLSGQLAEFRRRFGTESPLDIWDRFDNERFRARHAVALLDAAGIPFDQPTPAATTPGTPEGTP